MRRRLFLLFTPFLVTAGKGLCAAPGRHIRSYGSGCEPYQNMLKKISLCQIITFQGFRIALL